jgi:hypothetical protein
VRQVLRRYNGVRAPPLSIAACRRQSVPACTAPRPCTPRTLLPRPPPARCPATRSEPPGRRPAPDRLRFRRSCRRSIAALISTATHSMLCMIRDTGRCAGRYKSVFIECGCLNRGTNSSFCCASSERSTSRRCAPHRLLPIGGAQTCQISQLPCVSHSAPPSHFLRRQV